MKLTFVWERRMSDFIVLGYIPGTNFQIGIVGWLTIFAALSAILYVIHRERRVRTIRFLLIRLSLSLAQYRQHKI
jgi:hypothetical protein